MQQKINVKPANESPKNIQNVSLDSKDFKIASWLDINSKQFANSEAFTELPSEVFGADYLQFSSSTKVLGSFTVKEESTVYVLIDSKITKTLNWLSDYKKLKKKRKTATEFHLRFSLKK